MEAHDIINLTVFNELKEQVGADFVIELVDTFCVETQEVIETLQHTLAAQDAVAFGRLAHSIKSSSASLGAMSFSQQARELEMLGKANDLARVGSMVDQLAADFLQVVSRLKELSNEP